MNGHEDTAIFETFVVPRYLSFFGERILHELTPGKDARVCHLYCRTGYPDRELLDKLPNAHVHGFDPSSHAIELARTKARALLEGQETNGGSIAFDYRVRDSLPLAYPSGVFSHGLALLTPSATEPRAAIMTELGRLVAPRGQALVAMPLRGSFFEIHDLLRECALKFELDGLEKAVDAAVDLRPTEHGFKAELEAVGFDRVSVDLRKRTLRFDGGRRFIEDPITRLVLLPELRAELGAAAEPRSDLDPFEYVVDAIDKYWSDAIFELTVYVGVVSGRKT